MVDYQALDDGKLVNLLFTKEDRLPRAAVDEFIRRGECMIEPLSKILLEESNWTKERPEFWAPIHAVFILGAIGTQEAVSPVITAIEWSEKYNVDWVFEVFPSIFGKIGIPALESLRQLAQDEEQDWYVRTIALQGLAAVAIYNPKAENDIILFIHSIFTNKEENMDVRVSAAGVLLGFKRSEHKESLLAFCKEQRKSMKPSPFSLVSFNEKDVERIFSENEKDVGLYTSDWLSFYDEGDIGRRQGRWKAEAEKKEDGQYEDESKVLLKLPAQKTPKLGRNSPCPCGSGKKYKRCCIGKELI